MESFCIIPYNCMLNYNDLKIKIHFIKNKETTKFLDRMVVPFYIHTNNDEKSSFFAFSPEFSTISIQIF